ncbi:MAG: VOC family protein [Eubacteriales bacterium]|nr:VOC family protein [Eubacteriales bacterium]
MKINRIDHIAVNTVNIEESVKYYEEMFGFKETSRADMGNVILVYMEVCPGSYLELFDLKGNCEKGTVPEEMQGLRHIAFHVDDIKAWEKRLKEKNAEFTMELTRMEPIHKDGILIRDPNGVIVELSADYT